MNLKQLLEGISYEVQQGTAEVEISDFQYDSRKVEKDGLFVCITGFRRSDTNIFPWHWKRGRLPFCVSTGGKRTRRRNRCL